VEGEPLDGSAHLPGRQALALGREELERLRATVIEQAMALHLHEENTPGTDGRPRSDQGWTLTSRPACSTWSRPRSSAAGRACELLRLDHARYHHWARRELGRLDDAPPDGNPLHGILPWECEAILELFEAWGGIDRSHRKLAHRGSRIDLVYVSASTIRAGAGRRSAPSDPEDESVTLVYSSSQMKLLE
jgi:hypothetical protein